MTERAIGKAMSKKDEKIKQLTQNQNNILTFGAAIIGVIVAATVNLNANLISCNNEYCLKEVATQYGLKITITCLLILIVLPTILYFMYLLCLFSSKQIYNMDACNEESSGDYIKILANILILASPLICALNISIYLLYLNFASKSCATKMLFEPSNGWLFVGFIFWHIIITSVIYGVEIININDTFKKKT